MMRRHLWNICLLVLSLALSGILCERLAEAQALSSTCSYFVDPGGSDANPGTEPLPFRTLARGVRDLTPGDTLCIKDGIYAEALIDSIPSGTSWDSPVTVAAAPGTVILKPNSGAEFVLHFQGPQQYIIIDGLILDATNVTYDAVKITAGGGSGPAHHIRLIRCELKNARGQGVSTSWSADWNEFIALNVHDNGSASAGFDHGLYISTSHNLVEDSTIHHNIGSGVVVYEQDAYKGRTNNNIVRSNRIHNNGISRAGMSLSSGDGNVAYNNLIWGNGGDGGIKVGYYNPTNTKIYNNTVYGNSTSGIYIEPDSSNAVIRNNVLYANGQPEVQNYGVGTVLDHNLVGIDPKFVNAAAGDFRLLPDSPAIDAGIAVSLVTTDMAGTPRPQGSAYDMGAYELPVDQPFLPTPDIKANGSDGPLTVPSGTNLTVTVALDPRRYTEYSADWWVAATTPMGLYWLTPDQGWVRSDTPLRVDGSPLVTLAPVEVLHTTGLPPGNYSFYFGVDLLLNGTLDWGQLHVDSVAVTIQ